MKKEDVFRLSKDEILLYLTVSWLDLTPEAQNRVMSMAKSAIGTPDYSFKFPNTEVRVLVKERKRKGDI